MIFTRITSILLFNISQSNKNKNKTDDESIIKERKTYGRGA